MKPLHEHDLERQLEVLSGIAACFEPCSEEARVLEAAANALHFVYGESVRERFRAFLAQAGDQLSDSQRAHLVRMGVLNPDGSIAE